MEQIVDEPQYKVYENENETFKMIGIPPINVPIRSDKSRQLRWFLVELHNKQKNYTITASVDKNGHYDKIKIDYGQFSREITFSYKIKVDKTTGEKYTDDLVNIYFKKDIIKEKGKPFEYKSDGVEYRNFGTSYFYHDHKYYLYGTNIEFTGEITSNEIIKKFLKYNEAFQKGIEFNSQVRYVNRKGR